MRLKDPLQGIKAIQGHTIIHIAMFISSFIIDARPAELWPVDGPAECGEDDFECWNR